MMKTKKIKILVSVILILVAIVASGIVAACTTKVSYAMGIPKPDRIVVYYNSSSNNMVFERDSDDYGNIYNSIIGSFKQRTIVSFVNGNLSKKPKIVEHASSVDFDGLKVNFVYDSPNVVKQKNNLYIIDGEECWYQSLIFDISSQNKYQYNSIAIIQPDNTFDYSVIYKAYSNFGKCYDDLIKLF